MTGTNQDRRQSLSSRVTAPAFSMDGASLVEASAGTGKTYSIQTLFLRLVIERGLQVRSILVVTFTEAATKELRDRLRSVLYKCQLAVEGALPSDDGDYVRVNDILALPLQGERIFPAYDAERAFRARRALLDFDEAAIHTIHGFCSRCLSRFAFECGHDFSAEVIGESSEVVEELCEDWWRRNVYAASPIRLAAMATGKVSLENLKRLAEERIAKPDALLRPAASQSAAPDIEELFRAMLDAWDREAVDAALTKARVSGTKLRANTRDKLFGQLDALERGRIAAEMFTGLERLTPEFLANALNQSSPGPPDHPFFERCSAFMDGLRAAAESALPCAARDVAAGYARRRRQRAVLSYDDILLDVRQALRNPQQNDALLAALRGEYAAALIDEFQDTDPVQYEIFRRVFIEAGAPVFLVGDPKQAIYGFRNGDIFTYYAAAEAVRRGRAGREYSLDKNFRSEKRLVDAVNQVFRDHDERAFINDHIAYPGALDAQGKPLEESLTVAGQTDAAPFRVWYYTDYAPQGKKAPPGQDNPYARRMYADAADEVVRLLNDDGTRIAGKRVQPSDIAMLVLTHREADYIHRELSRRRVPAVRQSTGNVFDSLEAEDMQLLMAVMADPTNLSAARSFLATDLVDLSDAELVALTEGERIREDETERSLRAAGLHTMEDYVAFFREANDRWRSGSFMQAFTYVGKRLRLRERVVGLADGERRLTNILQLADLIHHAAVARRLGVDGALNWIARQRAASTREQDDAYEMRLESDADAVQIMTVFKSKGLQFPIVFAPTMWRRKPEAKRKNEIVVEYHEPVAASGPAAGEAEESCEVEGDSSDVPRMILDVSADKDAEEKAKQEKRQEDVRLFYVAVTRAIHRVYVIWGDLHNDDGALAHVLDDGPLKAHDTARDMQARGQDERAVGAALLTLRAQAKREEGWAPERCERSSAQSPADLRGADDPWFEVDVDKTHGHTSFSGFAPHDQAPSAGDAEERDYDGEDAGEEPEDESRNELTIFTFPAGRRTGHCWHAIFENMDFTWLSDGPNSNEGSAREIVQKMLKLYGLREPPGTPEDEQRAEIVFDMVRRTLRQELWPDAGFVLADVPRSDRLAEMEFSFPLRDEPGRRASVVADVLERRWRGDPVKKPFLDRIRASAWGKGGGGGELIPRGFMTGCIDLFFRHGGRYYVLDWKSNRRGGRPQDFDETGLREEMAAHTYFLQYLVYTVAAHKYLEGCLPDYGYDERFGGVCYVFLRGVDGRTPGRGVFFDRPGPELIEDIAAELGDFR